MVEYLIVVVIPSFVFKYYVVCIVGCCRLWFGSRYCIIAMSATDSNNNVCPSPLRCLAPIPIAFGSRRVFPITDLQADFASLVFWREPQEH